LYCERERGGERERERERERDGEGERWGERGREREMGVQLTLLDWLTVQGGVKYERMIVL
jgi:hypothetical protein